MLWSLTACSWQLLHLICCNSPMVALHLPKFCGNIVQLFLPVFGPYVFDLTDLMAGLNQHVSTNHRWHEPFRSLHNRLSVTLWNE